MKTAWQQDGADKTVTSPMSLVITAFGVVQDIRNTVTPELRTDKGETSLLLVDLGAGKNRLGGSCLAQVFGELGDVAPDLDDAALLRGFFEGLGIAEGERQALVLREIDKLDKRGADAVRATLTGPDFQLADEVADRIMAFVQVRSTSHADALARLDALGAGNPTLAEGVAELREVIELLKAQGVPETDYAVNFSIARGLDYYTGTVYETTLDEHPQIGSVCSGGRYENLASHYTKSKLPGVGISIGATRLFWQLREAGIVSTAESSVQALVGLMDDARLPDSLDIARRLRAAGINAEVQLEVKKLAKQFQYADRAGIRFVLLLGEEEATRGVVAVKDMRKQEQFEVPRGELAAALRVELEQHRATGGR